MLDDLATYQARTNAYLRHMARIEDEKDTLWILRTACIPKYLTLCIKHAITNIVPHVSLLCAWQDLAGKREYHRIQGW